MLRLLPHSTTRLLLLVSGVLGVALLLRFATTGNHAATFLAWNLFLAWIPYVAALGIEHLALRVRVGTAALLLPTAVWLLFLPNAPYIVTDIIHLRFERFPHALLDGLLISAFAATGLVLGLLSLRRVHAVMIDRRGARFGQAFVISVLLLSGAGVWVGRMLRWNSWDVVTNPWTIIKTTAHAALTPWNHLPAVGFSLLFAAGLYACYARLPSRQRSRVRAGGR